MAKAPAAPKITLPEQDWALPPVNEFGVQLHSDGFPIAKLARAMALAAAGITTDPEGLVEPEDIAAHDPKPLEADRVAIEAAQAGAELEAQPSAPVTTEGE